MSKDSRPAVTCSVPQGCEWRGQAVVARGETHQWLCLLGRVLGGPGLRCGRRGSPGQSLKGSAKPCNGASWE